MATLSEPQCAGGLPLQRAPEDVANVPAASPAKQPRWEQRYGQLLVVVDCVAICVAVATALIFRFGADAGETLSGVPYELLSVALGCTWLMFLGGHRAYERRFLDIGVEEYKRVGLASVRLGGLVAIVSYAGKLETARGFVAVAFPLGLLLLLVGRLSVRKYLHRGRAFGRFQRRMVVVGSLTHVSELVRAIRRERYTGYEIVGACVPGGAVDVDVDVDGDPVPVLGGLTGVVEVIKLAAAHTVAVAASPGMTSEALRRLGWELEGTGIDLIVAPTLTDVAGPRISIRPVAGLPLLHVEEPEIAGFWHVVRDTAYWITALLLVVLLSPLLLGLAIAVRLDSRGAVLFRQARVGLNGRAFTVFKFRSMYADAETRLAGLAQLNDSNGLLFKLRDDPRVTRVGRLLRKYSLDELPQLLNVLTGDMALVGPRPPLPTEVAAYGFDVKRRLLVKPGITGLWQVSGRSDLSWEESVRLDLYYVENWSPALDIQILWKTMFAVLRGSGAY